MIPWKPQKYLPWKLLDLHCYLCGEVFGKSAYQYTLPIFYCLECNKIREAEMEGEEE